LACDDGYVLNQPSSVLGRQICEASNR
jgi:hypothetical protein